MKLWIAYIAVFSLGLVSFLVLISSTPSPESLIVGEWQEKSWVYERTDQNIVKSEMDSLEDKKLTENVKKYLGQNLVIHKAETWTFLPNGQLRLKSDELDRTVNWRMKGRGNILEIKYGDGITEYYNLSSLDDWTLVLNYESDMQAKGIAKLTFERN